MKELKTQLKIFKTRVKIDMILLSFGLLMLLTFAIVVLIVLPQLWRIGLLLLGIVAVAVIGYFFYIKYIKKKIKVMERELENAEKRQALNEQNIDTSH